MHKVLSNSHSVLRLQGSKLRGIKHKLRLQSNLNLNLMKLLLINPAGSILRIIDKENV